MTSRRSFVMGSGLTAAAARSVVGANDKIRMGAIGLGVRGVYVAPVFAAHPDCEVVAVCDVYKPNREKALEALAPARPDAYVDYRKVLERKDIDAVLIASPDHWHARMVAEACEAGKDVYCEKPLSNSIEDGWRAVEAARRYNRVVQVGLQQRSWQHFKEWCQKVQGGMFGTIYHAGLHWVGHYSREPEAPTDPPADLDWELFQGPAERRPFSPSRQRNWRGYYDYGGGIITDQGVHLADLVHWYLGAQAPASATASAQWVRVAKPNPEQPPDTFAITWQYPNFVMTYSNTYMPEPGYPTDHGVYFFGTVGTLHIARTGWAARPLPVRRRAGEPETPPPFKAEETRFRYAGEEANQGHTRDFLDCVKSRRRPITDVETGFYSTLPLLLGVLAVRHNRMFRWDGRKAVSVSA